VYFAAFYLFALLVSNSSCYMLTLLLGIFTPWKWALLPMFWRFMLRLFSGSKEVRPVNDWTSLTLLASSLKMEVACTAETSPTVPTYTLCKYPRLGSKSTIGRPESMKLISCVYIMCFGADGLPYGVC
jgi:hypothetical protein